MTKRFTTKPEEPEIESCYPDENGIYVPWSEIAAKIDAKWNRIELRERIFSLIGSIIFIVVMSYGLVKIGVVDRGNHKPAPTSVSHTEPTAENPAWNDEAERAWQASFHAWDTKPIAPVPAPPGSRP